MPVDNGPEDRGWQAAWISHEVAQNQVAIVETVGFDACYESCRQSARCRQEIRGATEFKQEKTADAEMMQQLAGGGDQGCQRPAMAEVGNLG